MSQSGIVKTGVDELIELLKARGKISMEEASKALNIRVEILQSWTDFLVEEEIVSVEYKFLTPYVSLLKNSESTSSFDSKTDFEQKAKLRNIPSEKINSLWYQYLVDHKEYIRMKFVEKAVRRGINRNLLPKLWEQYYQKLIEESKNGN